MMTTTQKFLLLLIRFSLGWIFLYSGLHKVLDPEWTSAGFLSGATNLTGFFSFFLQDSVLPIVDFLNAWGQTVLGLSLILGFLVRFSAPLGALLMILYWLPQIETWDWSVVDSHIVYAAALLFLAAVGAGKFWGFDKRIFG